MKKKLFVDILNTRLVSSVTSKNVYKSCPKKDFANKMKYFDKFTKIA